MLEHLRIDPRVYNTIQLNQIYLELRKMNQETAAKGLPFDRTTIYKWLEIQAGESAVVYQYDLSGMVAFISYVGVKWYANSHIDFTIDGTLREKIERTIGNFVSPTSQPEYYDPPIIAKNQILFKAYNQDTTEHKFEILCDGALYTYEQAKLMRGVR